MFNDLLHQTASLQVDTANLRANPFQYGRRVVIQRPQYLLFDASERGMTSLQFLGQVTKSL